MPDKRKKKKSTAKTVNAFMEISIDPSLLNNYSNEQGITHFLSTISASSEFYKLKLELIKEVLRIIDEGLTKKQRDIIKMTYIEGKTQNEIACLMGNHQTAIHKAIAGNIDYSNDKKRYGGAIKKLRKLCSKSKKIQKILNKIREKSEAQEGIH